LVVSKVYYYLEEYDEALSFALSAGPTFETEAHTQGAEEYVETVVCAYEPPEFSIILTPDQPEPLIDISPYGQLPHFQKRR
jgi:hypothetical protein